MKRFCLILSMMAALASTGCTTTGSSTRSGSERSGVTIFGDIDAGVSRVR